MNEIMIIIIQKMGCEVCGRSASSRGVKWSCGVSHTLCDQHYNNQAKCPIHKVK